MFDSSFYFIIIVLPLVLPFVAGMAILMSRGEDDLNRLIGFFTIKPVLAYPLWFYMMNTVVTTWYDNWLDNIVQRLDKALPLLPAIILSLVIIYNFRGLFTNRFAQLFLCLDVLRMLNTIILVNLDGNIFFLAFGLFLPSIVAILALIIVFTNSEWFTPKA